MKNYYSLMRYVIDDAGHLWPIDRKKPLRASKIVGLKDNLDTNKIISWKAIKKTIRLGKVAIGYPLTFEDGKIRTWQSKEEIRLVPFPAKNITFEEHRWYCSGQPISTSLAQVILALSASAPWFHWWATQNDNKHREGFATVSVINKNFCAVLAERAKILYLLTKNGGKWKVTRKIRNVASIQGIAGNDRAFILRLREDLLSSPFSTNTKTYVFDLKDEKLPGTLPKTFEKLFGA